MCFSFIIISKLTEANGNLLQLKKKYGMLFLRFRYHWTRIEHNNRYIGKGK